MKDYITDDSKGRIEAKRVEYLKRHRARKDRMVETIAKQVAEDAENAGARGMNLDEAIKALEKFG